MNGELMKELRALAATEGKLSTETALRLLLGAQADMADQQSTVLKKLLDSDTDRHNLRDSVTKLSLEIKTRDAEYVRAFAEMRAELEELRTSASAFTTVAGEMGNLSNTVTQMTNLIKNTVVDNYAIKIGAFIKSNPKTSTTILAVFFVVSNVWFISGFRRAVITWLMSVLGFPPEVIANVMNLLAP